MPATASKCLLVLHRHLCRPGSVIGPQQNFLGDMEKRMWREGEAYRRCPRPVPGPMQPSLLLHIQAFNSGVAQAHGWDELASKHPCSSCRRIEQCRHVAPLRWIAPLHVPHARTRRSARKAQVACIGEDVFADVYRNLVLVVVRQEVL